jgi:hypothetical protein
MKKTKLTTLTILAVAALLAAGTAFSQNNPGSCGAGYGGPPKSAEERAARQAACLEKNGGVCPQGGPRANCPGKGYGKAGKGQGQGNCYRRGARDGTGPRAGTGTCPAQVAPAQK